MFYCFFMNHFFCKHTFYCRLWNAWNHIELYCILIFRIKELNFSKSPKVILWCHVAYCFALYFYLWYFLVYIYDIFMVGVSLCCIIWFPNSVVRCFRMFLVTRTEMVGYRQIWGHVKKVESIKCIQHSRIVIEIILLSYFKACIVI